MAAPPPPAPLVPSARPEHVFPILTPLQVARIAGHGRLRGVERGDVLLAVGDPNARFFVVTAGRLEALRTTGDAEQLVAAFGAGQFTGEISLLSGRPGLVRIRAAEPGEVIELDRPQLLALVQTDSELGEVLMRAFILRRVELVAQHVGDVVLVGSAYSAGTLRVREFLTRNGHPHAYIDLDRDPDVRPWPSCTRY